VGSGRRATTMSGRPAASRLPLPTSRPHTILQRGGGAPTHLHTAHPYPSHPALAACTKLNQRTITYTSVRDLEIDDVQSIQQSHKTDKP